MQCARTWCAMYKVDACIKKCYRLYSVQLISVQSREVCNVGRCITGFTVI